MMMKFTKGGLVKLIDQNSSLVPLLRADGWVVEGETPPARRGRPPKEKNLEDSEE